MTANTLDLDAKPKLRWPLDVQNVEHEGRQYILLNDPQGITPEVISIHQGMVAVLARLDGENSLQSILDEGGPFGLTKEILLNFVARLQQMLLLDGPEVEKRWKQIKEDYRNATVREAAHADRVYSSDPKILREEISAFIDKTKDFVAIPKSDRPIVAMICPHIDYQRGWHTYGTAYHALQGVEQPDVIFLIGTAHQPGQSLYHLTDKDFATPLGTVSVAKDIVARLAKNYGIERSFRDEILHRQEHSLELQLPFIAHRYGADSIPQIVPILVGSFQPLFDGGKTPIEHAEVGDFIDSLAEILSEMRINGKRMLFYAGIDFSHMGVFFGDPEPVAANGLEEIERRDKELLDCVLAADEERLFAHMAEDNDSRRVCGYPSLYTMLASMRRAGYNLNGHAIDYRQAVDKESDCIVTFASAYWTEL